MNGDGIADPIGSSQNANAANGSLTGQAYVFFESINIGNIPTNGSDLNGSDGVAFTGAFAANFSDIDMLMNNNKIQLEEIKDIGPVVGDNIYNFFKLPIIFNLFSFFRIS